jgi:hypothetical protein
VTALAQAAAVGIVTGTLAAPTRHWTVEGAGILGRLGRVFTYISGYLFIGDLAVAGIRNDGLDVDLFAPTYLAGPAGGQAVRGGDNGLAGS